MPQCSIGTSLTTSRLDGVGRRKMRAIS